MSITFSLYRNSDGTLDGRYPAGDKPANLSGRLSFYIDYSELSSVGTHTFYVARTHGTSGAVTVDYATAGDAHSSTSGTLSWADGDFGIKSFTATVGSKSNGDHRIYAYLSNPTGGAVLHNADKTKAYGVIDDGTIAPDSDAVFFDADAVSNGAGTQASPYNNIYDAIANVGSKRYIYGKGTQTVDTTAAISVFGVTNYGIPMPPTRASEETRVYVRNWPSFTCTIQGDGTTSRRGFASYETDYSYHTYRGLDFQNFDNTTIGSCASIGYYYGNVTDINIELCTTINISGKTGTNNSAYATWGVTGGKIWRCTSDNVETGGLNTNENTAGYEVYEANHISIQRCEFKNSYQGIYHKIALDSPDAVTTSARFNIFGPNVENGVEYAGNSGRPPNNYALVQSNLFNGSGCRVWPRDGSPNGECQQPHVSNNIFDTFGTGDQGAMKWGNTDNAFVYNNIYYQCRREMLDYEAIATPRDNIFEIYDYNCGFGTTYSPEFRLNGVNLTRAQWLAEGYSANDIQLDPLFTNRLAGDYTLSGTSPCLGAGRGSTDMGVYLTGNEILGA